MKKTLAFFSAASLAVIACSSSKGTTASTTPGADGGFATFAAGPTTWVMKESVPKSSEIFKCQYVQMPSTTGFVVGGKHQFTVGSHHLVMYKTDLTAIPAGQTDVGDCYEGSDGTTPDFMNHIRGVVYTSQSPTGTLALPENVGLPFVAGEVYLFQSHYINTKAAPFDAEVDVQLDTVTKGPTINAGVLFFYDVFIDVPANATAKASNRCPIPKDITLFSQASHYHARGNGFQAYLDTATTKATTPFYTSNNWESPTIGTETMQVKAGSFIRYYCDYDNTQGPLEYFQGQSAQTNEMCMFVGMYYPALDAETELCYNADTFGTGTTQCLDTLDCLSACPPNDANQGSGPPGTNFNACIQKCFVASCPNVGAPLYTFIDCSDQKCATECSGASSGDGGTSGDGGVSSACTSCITTNCASEYLACSNLTGCE